MLPLFELLGGAALEWAGDDTDGVAARVGAEIDRNMEGGGVVAPALDFAFAGFDAVQDGMALQFHGCSFLAVMQAGSRTGLVRSP